MNEQLDERCRTQEADPTFQRINLILKRIYLTLACVMIAQAWVLVKFAQAGLLKTDYHERMSCLGAVVVISTALYILWDSLAAALTDMRQALLARKGWGTRHWACLATALAVLVATWLAPSLAVNFSNPRAVLGCGHRRVEQGRWGDALSIYRLARTLDTYAVANVREMETLLTQSGYFKYPIDGVPDRHIMAALRQLQREYGFEPTGIVDPETRTVLYGLAHRRQLNVGPWSRPGYTTIKAAVIEFQQEHRLPADGNIDSDTLRALKATERDKTKGTRDHHPADPLSRGEGTFV